jgi:DNA-binding protein
MKMTRILAMMIAIVAAAALLQDQVHAQNVGNNGFFGQAVGGVSVSPDGVLAMPIAKDLALSREAYTKAIKPQAEALRNKVGMRMISLRAIEEALAKSTDKNGNDLPQDIIFMAGLQRIEFVFLYPEQNDIVLAGPGEGWKVDANANIVGITTGRPVLRLEDFLLAMRTTENARNGGISVSIDPTEEGRKALDSVLAGIKQYNEGVAEVIEKALGPQKISINGVPATSRMARTLVAGDYKMKRIAMKLEQSPVKGLGSYVDMLKAAPKNMMPRWWMACDYEPLAKSADGLAWQLRGRGVKVMTEDEVVANGKVAGTGKTSDAAQKWADTMTAKYDDLSVAEPVFGEVRNVMDLCVISALIAKEKLLAKSHLEVPTLLGTNSKVEPNVWNAPQFVSTECSVTHKSRNYIITASGGVDINSWAIADKTQEVAAVGETRQKAAPKNAGSLYW